MNGASHFDRLDPEVQTFLAKRYGVFERNASLNQASARMAAPIRRYRRERLAKLMGMDFAERSQLLRRPDAEEERMVAAFQKNVRTASQAERAPSADARANVTPQGSPPIATLHPYYMSVVNSSTGAVIEDVYNIQGVPSYKREFRVEGTGDGNQDSDRDIETADVDWLMSFTPLDTRVYHFFPTTAYYAWYMIYSDDTFLTSLQAHLTIRILATTYGAGVASLTLYDRDSDNINEQGYMGAPGAGGEAQLHVAAFLQAGQPIIVTFTHSFYLYARGFPAWVDLDYKSGQQALGPVWCYVF
jgi:hypothetical protein